MTKGQLKDAEPLLLFALQKRRSPRVMEEGFGAFFWVLRPCARSGQGCEVLGQDHPDTLHTMNVCARLFREKGDLGTAEALYRQALECRRSAQSRLRPEL